MISQVLFTFEQPRENKMAFVGILSQIKLLFGPLVIQLVWYLQLLWDRKTKFALFTVGYKKSYLQKNFIII